MIKGVLIVNNHGKARLAKFYDEVVRFVTPVSFLVRFSALDERNVCFRCAAVGSAR